LATERAKQSNIDPQKQQKNFIKRIPIPENQNLEEINEQT